MRRSAEISECGRFRYFLTREWGERRAVRPMVFCMLNPSTADANLDDPTIRRCMTFAKREGCDGLEVVNLFAFRATDPRELSKQVDAIGPRNTLALGEALLISKVAGSPFVMGCGAHEMARPELAKMARRARDFDLPLYCLGKTQSGAPRHPLHLANDAPLIPWGRDE